VAGLVETVRHVIRERRLFLRGQRILVAVSGGVDSMVLLHVLHQISKSNRWRLAAAHLNHQLRGHCSDADERLVTRFAMRLEIPVVVEKADVRGLSRRGKLSLEMAARKLRHEFLARAARQFGCHTVALAHHADDQLELFFLRLLRGSGAQGLAGMKWKNPSPADPRVELVRTLLEIPKSDLLDYATKQKILFREDATNACLDILRNRVRHQLLPLLKRHYQPGLERVVARTTEILRAESDLVQSEAEAWRIRTRNVKSGIGKADDSFDQLSVAVQRQVVQAELIQLGIPPDYELIEKLRTSAGQPVSICSIEKTRAADSRAQPNLLGWHLLRDSTGLVHLQETASSGFDPDSLNCELRGNHGEIEFSHLRIRWQLKKSSGKHLQSIKHHRPASEESFDAEKVGSSIVLRHWRPGDRFQPIGMPFELKLQDFFTNEKVPKARRRQLMVATDAKGRIFWVEGMRIAERFKLTESTIRRLHWVWERL
jgi:tRNA(Ile)-lysidine synthase